MTTPSDVAQWMADEMKTRDAVYQEEFAQTIHDKFGEEFTYVNENGNLAIDKKVLKGFRVLTVGTVVWERGDRLWRKRQPTDPEGKRQAE